MTSGHLTSLLMPGDGSGTTFLAEVLGAEPTATTYIVRCPAEGSTYVGCSMDLSVTLGPWASKTLPAGAPSTGAVDWFATSVAGQDYAFSMHCDMTRSVAKACTLASIGGDGTDDATVNAAAVSVVTVTATRDLNLSGLHTWPYAPVLVTAGESLLTATSSASQDTSDAAPASDTAQATDASGTSDSGNSSGAVSCLGHGLAAISAAAIASIIILS